MIQAESEGREVEELEQYRLRNRELRRRLREKDLRIMELFDCIDQATGKIGFSAPHSKLNSSLLSPHPHRSVKVTQSEAKREKRTTMGTSIDSGNIFKQQSSNLVGTDNRKEIRLPALDKRTKLEFAYPQEDSIMENPESRPKLVRIPLDRLKPLNSKEVKKRFLMKFHRKEDERPIE